MSSIIVVFPKKEIATNIRNILVRNGFDVIGVGVTGAQAVQLADNLDDGIVVDSLHHALRDTKHDKKCSVIIHNRLTVAHCKKI